MRSDAHQIADAEREEETRHNDDCKVGISASIERMRSLCRSSASVGSSGKII
jgi:hypothetical protein